MPPAAVTRPNVLTDPGYLFIAPLLTTLPTNTVAGGVFTDAWPVAWLPLGATALTGGGATMENLLGEDADRWPVLLEEPGAHLHLYGKTMRAGRKMGHVTRVEQ